jgi:hypothetical protein
LIKISLLLARTGLPNYQVAEFTDRFNSFGGEASGTYNAITDGGSSGTGRADQVLQARLNFDLHDTFDYFKQLEVNIQLQTPQPIPNIQGTNYNYGFGISSIFTVSNNISLGIAYNFSSVNAPKIPTKKRMGIKGNMSAILLGIRWYNDDWYLGLTLSKSKNLQTSNNLEYFNGTGIELYTQYQFYPKFHLLGGLNYLSPDSDQEQAGNYLLSYYIFGLKYEIKDFSRLFYIEGRMDKGKTYNDYIKGNQITAGIRWDFDL